MVHRLFWAAAGVMALASVFAVWQGGVREHGATAAFFCGGLAFMAFMAWQDWRLGRAPRGPRVRVTSAAEGLSCAYGRGEARRVAWADVTLVGIRTTADGPWQDDLFWGFHTGARAPALVVPGGADGEQEMMRALGQHLEGVDWEEVARAQGSATDAYFVVWRAPGDTDATAYAPPPREPPAAR
jgi:hypothetical protein